jgi:multidrug efflux pump subunit AcrB
MWIVRLALRRPYTFTVMAILIGLLGIVTIVRMATDIFPSIENQSRLRRQRDHQFR